MEFRLLLAFMLLGCVWAQDEDDGCSQEDLERCTNELQMLEVVESLFVGSRLCMENLEVWKCLETYSNRCIPEGEMADDLRETFEALHQKIEDICTEEDDDTAADEISDENEVQEAIQCLRQYENDAGECVSEVISDVIVVALENDNDDDDDFDENEMECMIMRKMTDCVIDRVKHRCGEELAEALKAGVEEELREFTDACASGQDVTNLSYSPVP